MEKGVVLGKKIEAGEALYPKPGILEGTYVRLEPLNAEKHYASLYKHYTEAPAVWDYLPLNQPKSFEQFDELANRGFWDKRGVGVAICKKEQPDQYVGLLQFFNIIPEQRTIQLFVLFSKELQRTTAATEAIYLYLKYCFDELGFWRVQWKLNPNNEASKTAAMRLGFKYEGLLRKNMITKGYVRGTEYYGMIDDQWPAIRTEMERWLQPSNFDVSGQQLSKLDAKSK